MQDRKFRVMFAFPSYGGNGGISSEVPDIRIWFTRVVQEAKADKRVSDVMEMTLADTPITMVRNRFVVEARNYDVDVLVMVDSDINPLLHEKETGWKEFFNSSFDFFCDHYDKGPCVVGAPYCGPPGDRGENVYVFEWVNYGDPTHQGDETPFSLEGIPRNVAARMVGIQECAALPTGMILYDMRAFGLIEPSPYPRSQVLDMLLEHKITKHEALTMLTDGFFYYEWKDDACSQKASTEDVTNTRDISMAGIAKLGYNPVYCNWDSPVGHWKPWCVSGRPKVIDTTGIAATFRRAVQQPIQCDEVALDAGEFIRQRQKVVK